ncbi:MAG: hypothetical protein IPM37_18840 [Hahellaceae bacterium]|nr:hypothetical protein [Hahellaceae bacterium]
MKKAKKGDFDTLWNMLPFLVLAAEMYNDEEVRKGLEFLISTVDSADDVVAWVDYLALPADGWEGEGDPPLVDAFGDNPQAALPLSFMFRQAQAAPNARRVVARVLGETLASVSRHLDATAAKALPEALAAIKQGLRGTLNPSTRRYVFKKELMGISAGMMARAGAKTVRNLVRGIRNARYHPAVLISFLAYLKYENACGRAIQAESESQANPDPGQTGPSESERLNCSRNGFSRTIRSSIYAKMRAAFSDIAADGQVKEAAPSDSPPERYQGDAHGALFHLEQLAFYHASHRLSDNFPAIKAVDGFRYVGFFDKAARIPDLTADNPLLEDDIFRRIRYIDIVLQGQDNQEQWIELKSYKAKSPNQRDVLAAGKIKTWKLTGTGSDTARDPASLHRQFTIDRAAFSLRAAWLAKNQSDRDRIEVVVVPASILWKFQKFEVRRRNNPTIHDVSPNLGAQNQPNSIRGQFAKDPDGNQDVLRVSLSANADTNQTIVDSGISSTIKTVLPQLGFDLLSEYAEEFDLQ